MTVVEFVNKTNKSRVTLVLSDQDVSEAIEHVSSWYGAYCAGDKYHVLVDGVKVKKDPNGVVAIKNGGRGE